MILWVLSTVVSSGPKKKYRIPRFNLLQKWGGDLYILFLRIGHLLFQTLKIQIAICSLFIE